MKRTSVFLIIILILLSFGINVTGMGLSDGLKDCPVNLTGFKRVYVKDVIDGDTIMINGDKLVRFLGIDTPEIYPRQEDYGEKAYKFTYSNLINKYIFLDYDKQKMDEYGRELAYVYLKDGTFFNALLLKKGYANLMLIPPNLFYSEFFWSLYRKARKKRRGLWQEYCFKEDLPVISWQQAEDYLGREVIVKGKIVDTYDSGDTVFLNFDEDFKQTLTAVIFAQNIYNFGGNPADFFLDRKLKIQGKIQEYRGSPEVILESPEQIIIVDDSKKAE